MAAAIWGSAAFLLPLTVTRPWSRLRPTTSSRGDRNGSAPAADSDTGTVQSGGLGVGVLLEDETASVPYAPDQEPQSNYQQS